MIFHDEPLETENSWAREFSEALSLECKESSSIDEHDSFILESPPPCSFSIPPESATCCATNAFASCNLLIARSSKTFRRMVVDAFVYRKHCKFRGCAIVLTLQLKQNRWMMVKTGVTSPVDSAGRSPLGQARDLKRSAAGRQPGLSKRKKKSIYNKKILLYNNKHEHVFNLVCTFGYSWP